MTEYEMRGSETKKVLDAIKRAGKPVSLAEMRASIDMNYNTMRGAVQRLLELGLIRRVDKGVYEPSKRER